MKTYRIEIVNHKRRSSEIEEIIECERPMFTRRDFKRWVIDELFYLAAQGNGYRCLTAQISCDGKKIMTVRCLTEVEGGTITAYIAAARPREVYRKLRAMVISE